MIDLSRLMEDEREIIAAMPAAIRVLKRAQLEAGLSEGADFKPYPQYVVRTAIELVQMQRPKRAI